MWGCVQMREAQDRVNGLAGLDYAFGVVYNESGQYCSSYPLDMLVFESELTGPFRPRNPQSAAKGVSHPSSLLFANSHLMLWCGVVWWWCGVVVSSE